MTRDHRGLPPLFICLLAAACAAAPASEPAPAGGDGVEHRDGAIIISGVALRDGAGSVLSALRGKVPNMRIRRVPGACPEITLRGHVTLETAVNPHVYVDGTRITDTCVLETLQTRDVAAVEVYPMGFTKRPGYGTHAHGLILVFMRG